MLNLRFSDFDLECGTDEAGRGCLAGPVTASALILPRDFKMDLLNDSKQLSEKTRKKLQPLIETSSVCFAITHVDADVIDDINILRASVKAMQDSIIQLSPSPLYIIVDGNSSIASEEIHKKSSVKRYSEIETNTFRNIPFSCIIKGDSKFMSIAAASVLAKTYRDEYMERIHEEFPMYNWKKNKGYPTKEHREAIKKYGPSKYHRMSFRLLPEQLEFDF
jgi:ribonuclease HII